MNRGGRHVLEVADGQIRVGGVPLEQINRAEQIRLGLRVAAAMQQEKAVRIVAIDNAESISRRNRAELASMAEELGLQWLMFVVADQEDAPEGAAQIVGGELIQEAK